jgi:hypothetical protein
VMQQSRLWAAAMDGPLEGLQGEPAIVHGSNRPAYDERE